MKKILNILAIVLCLSTAVSCEDFREIVTLNDHPTTFVLNTPAFANNNYDLDNSSVVVLTCSQPDFGFTAPVLYTTQVSLENDFETEGKYKTFSIASTTARIELPADEFAAFVTSLSGKEESAFPITEKVYLRVIARVKNTDATIASNVITLNEVSTRFALPPVEFKDNIFVVGANIGKAWSTWKPVAPVYGIPGEYYTLVYNGGGNDNGLKWGEAEGDWRGFSALKSIVDNAGAGITQKADDDNLVFANPGWYVLHFEATVVGQTIEYTLKVETGKAFIIGACANGEWNGGDAAWEMVPNDEGIHVSPAFVGGGELRAYILVPGLDWWRTEFTLYNGDLYFRNVDIPNNWAESKGSAYSVQGADGQKLYANFNFNTGEVK
jgi:hypothetical protein